MRLRLFLIVLAVINVYLTVTWFSAWYIELAAVVTSAFTAVIKFFTKGILWQKILALLKSLKAWSTVVTIRGLIKFFGKGVLSRIWEWLHDRHIEVRGYFYTALMYSSFVTDEIVAFWRRRVMFDKVLIIIGTIQIAAIPLIYFAVIHLRMFIVQKVGEAAVEKGAKKVADSPSVQAAKKVVVEKVAENPHVQRVAKAVAEHPHVQRVTGNKHVRSTAKFAVEQLPFTKSKGGKDDVEKDSPKIADGAEHENSSQPKA